MRAGKCCGSEIILSLGVADWVPHHSHFLKGGRGTPTGNKVTANMPDNLDIDASPYIYGAKTLEQLMDELLLEIQEVANGKLTKAEALGYTEMAIARICNYM